MFIVYVPSLLSEVHKGVIVWEEVYRTDDYLAATIVCEWHENVGIRTKICNV